MSLQGIEMRRDQGGRNRRVLLRGEVLKYRRDRIRRGYLVH